MREKRASVNRRAAFRQYLSLEIDKQKVFRLFKSLENILFQAGERLFLHCHVGVIAETLQHHGDIRRDLRFIGSFSLPATEKDASSHFEANHELMAKNSMLSTPGNE